MGTSLRMIERHYGALLDGSGAEIAARSMRSKPIGGVRTRSKVKTDEAFGPLPGHVRSRADAGLGSGMGSG
jgi:hypothetical protein